MTLHKLRKVSYEESHRLGISGYVWLVNYDHKTWHYNLKAKTFTGLIWEIIKIYVRSHTN